MVVMFSGILFLLLMYFQVILKYLDLYFSSRLPWNKIRTLVIDKVDKAMKTFEREVPMGSVQSCPNVETVTFEQMRQRILNQLKEFSG